MGSCGRSVEDWSQIADGSREVGAEMGSVWPSEKGQAEAKSQLMVAANGRLVQEGRSLRTCLETEKVAEEISEEEEADVKGNSNN